MAIKLAPNVSEAVKGQVDLASTSSSQPGIIHHSIQTLIKAAAASASTAQRLYSIHLSLFFLSLSETKANTSAFGRSNNGGGCQLSPLYLICNREDEPLELNEGRKMERNDAAGREKKGKSVVKFNLKCSGEDKQVGQSGGEEKREERRERGRQSGN